MKQHLSKEHMGQVSFKNIFKCVQIKTTTLNMGGMQRKQCLEGNV